MFSKESKQFDRDISINAPQSRDCTTEHPQLDTGVAPYLPLNRKYAAADSEYYVLEQGKVCALDSIGFLVPAGLALDVEQVLALAVAGGDTDPLTLNRYTATDVEQKVLNAAGNVVVANEPVCWSWIDTGAGLGSLGVYAAPGTIPLGAGFSLTVGYPIGRANKPYLRAFHDTIAGNTSDLDNVARVGGEMIRAENPFAIARHRNNVKEQQVTVEVSMHTFKYPMVANSSAGKVKGQALYIGALPPRLGDRVTFDFESNMILAVAPAALDQVQNYIHRTVGYVIKVTGDGGWRERNLMSQVHTIQGAHVPGTSDLLRATGSATGGLPAHMYYANSTVEIQISPVIK